MRLLPKVSIVIPCYNHGRYLKEALSNLNNESGLYEIIIVNDGSDEAKTLQVLDDLKAKHFNIVFQENKGLSEARNTGIFHSKGDYILFLDADNSIEVDFINKAAEIFDADSEIAVVYSDAEYVGNKIGRWNVGEFNLQRLMITNYIDACAMVRKTVFDELGGYDSNMIGGWEDWELWLRIAFAGKKFYYLPEVGFKYRTYPGSMSGVLGKSFEIRNRLKTYLHEKYKGKMGQEYITDFVITRFKKSPLKFVTKLVMISWFNKVYKNLLKENKIIKGI